MPPNIISSCMPNEQRHEGKDLSSCGRVVDTHCALATEEGGEEIIHPLSGRIRFMSTSIIVVITTLPSD